ncbi:MAG: beta-ketoacyl synthase chain length factor [Steroidobacteraceae bacterium]
MTALTVAIEGIGIRGPGLPDWPGCCAVLSGAAPYARARTVLPAPDVLPPPERRRAGRVVKLALAVGAEAVRHSGRDARTLASVFSSSGGDGDNCHEICVALAQTQRLISPTRFHNSVHNAAAGYWSIAYGCTEPSITLSAYDASFTAGLLEAVTQVAQTSRPALLISYDADYPPPLQSQRRIADAFGVGLVLAPVDAGSSSSGAGALTRMRVSLSREPADRLDWAEFEALRLAIPAARSLPLLTRLAQARSGRVLLEYLQGQSLALEFDP